MNIQTYRTNINKYNSSPIKRKNNSKLIITDPLPKEILRHENHGTAESYEGPILERKQIPSDDTVFIIMKKFKGTLLTGNLKCEINAADIYPTAS